MSEINRKRVFFALALPEKARGACEEFRKTHEALEVHWGSSENLHLTVLFLGGVPKEKLGELVQRSRKVLATTQTGAIQLSGFDWGPPKSTPRMIWLNASASREWNDIKKALREATKNLDIYRGTDERPFTPHVTIARMETKPRRALSDIQTPFSFAFTPKEILLIESKLSPKGATYSVLERFPFSV